MNYNIFDFCRNGDLESVKRLIEEHKVLHGGSEILDGFGSSLLHYASEFGHLEIVKYLVEEVGMNSETQNEDRDTPLQYASWFGYLEIVKYLVEEMNVNPETQDDFGYTPLHDASHQSHLEIVKYFIRHDVDISIKNNDGKHFFRPS